MFYEFGFSDSVDSDCSEKCKVQDSPQQESKDSSATEMTTSAVVQPKNGPLQHAHSKESIQPAETQLTVENITGQQLEPTSAFLSNLSTSKKHNISTSSITTSYSQVQGQRFSTVCQQ